MPAPPLIVSAPRPPMITSLPSPPLIVSLPPNPKIVSSPPRPRMSSASSVTPSSRLNVSLPGVPLTLAMGASFQVSNLICGTIGTRCCSGAASAGALSAALDVLFDERIGAQTHRTRGAVLVVALEVDRLLAQTDPTHRVKQQAPGLGRARRPGIDDHAIPVAAVLVGQARTSREPGLRLVHGGERPTNEALDLLLLVDREVVVPTIDLADQNARPIAEAQVGESGLDHQMAHRQSERHVWVACLKESECRRLARLGCCFAVVCQLHQLSLPNGHETLRDGCRRRRRWMIDGRAVGMAPSCDDHRLMISTRPPFTIVAMTVGETADEQCRSLVSLHEINHDQLTRASRPFGGCWRACMDWCIQKNQRGVFT